MIFARAIPYSVQVPNQCAHQSCARVRSMATTSSSHSFPHPGRKREPMLLNWALPVKNTFVHFALFEWCEPHRSKSAPPTVSFPHPAPANADKKRKKPAAATARAAEPDDDDAALRDFTAQAREERWAFLAERVLSRRSEIAWRWNRVARALPEKDLEPVRRATLNGRAFTHVLQYAMRSPLDLIHFHCASVLRATGGSFEVWATDAIAQAPKVKSLIRTAHHFTALARRCQIMLHLPDRQMFVLPWEPDFPVGALQGKALHGCGLPPERQRLQCLGQDLRGDTVGATGVLPGDVIDVIEVAR